MNKLVKRITAAALSVVMIAGAFAGCSADGKKGSAGEAGAKKEYNIGICQLVQHEALDAATKGFMDKLTAMGKEDGIKFNFDNKNAAGEPSTAATICNKFVTNKVDLIMANATPAVQAAMAATSEIPILGTSVTHYGTALDIKDWKGTTGMNISGTADLAPLDQQAAMLKELFPDAKKVGIVYCSSEANSIYQATVVADELKKLGLTTEMYTVSDTNDIGKVVTVACEKSDALYIPTDNMMASSTGIIEPIVSASKTPVIAGEEGICAGCGVATLSISYYALGEKTAEMAYDILVNGKDVSKMEIGFDTAPVFKYVPSRAKALGITVPDSYVAIEE